MSIFWKAMLVGVLLGLVLVHPARSESPRRQGGDGADVIEQSEVYGVGPGDVQVKVDLHRRGGGALERAFETSGGFLLGPKIRHVLPLEIGPDVLAINVGHRRDIQGEDQRADRDLGGMGQVPRVAQDAALMFRIRVKHVDAHTEEIVEIDFWELFLERRSVFCGHDEEVFSQLFYAFHLLGDNLEALHSANDESLQLFQPGAVRY